METVNVSIEAPGGQVDSVDQLRGKVLSADNGGEPISLVQRRPYQFTPAPYLVDHSIVPKNVVFMSPAAVGKTTTATANLQMMFYAALLNCTLDEYTIIREHERLQRFVDHQWPTNRVAAAAVRHALENWK